MFDRYFYRMMGYILLSLVVLGFGSAALVREQNPLELPILFHIHALSYLAWFALFIVQASLIAKGNQRMHVKLGSMSPVLLLAMLATGWMMAVGSFERGVSPIPDISIEQFMAFPLFDLLGLIVFYGLAIFRRSDAVFHKRAMLLALIAIMDPATARFGMTIGVPPFPLIASIALVCLVMWHDRKSLSRVHLVTWLGFIWIFLRLGFVFGFAASDTWASIANVLFS